MYEQTSGNLERSRERREALKKAMLEAMSKQSPTQMVSGRAVSDPYSPLSKIGQALIYKNALGRNKEEQLEAEQAFGEGREDAFTELKDIYSGREEVLDAADMTTPERESARPGDRVEAAMFASQNPYLSDSGIGRQIMPVKNRGSYFTNTLGPRGYLQHNARTGESEYKPYPEGFGTPIKQDIPHQAALTGAKKTAEYESKREFNMEGINSVLNLAENILTGAETGTQPTGSGFGAAYDYLSSVVGHTPSGATEAQDLKAVGGALVAKMPRMEGPQSDRDVIVYKQMAAEIGDPTVPPERKLSALRRVRQIWAKYEHLQGVDQSASEFNVIERTDEAAKPSRQQLLDKY